MTDWVAGALCERARAISEREIARAERRLRGLTASELRLVEMVVSRVVGSLLAEPLRRIETAATHAEALAYAASIDDLFALNLRAWPADASPAGSQLLGR
ncbi:MAG: hypothetical protein ACRDNY_14015 [Gaiellaceae bacterium]